MPLRGLKIIGISQADFVLILIVIETATRLNTGR
jgi:hypothetical protein